MTSYLYNMKYNNSLPVTSYELEQTSNRIMAFLSGNNVVVYKIDYDAGASVSLFKVYLESKRQISRMMANADNLARTLGTVGIRIFRMEEYIGVEVPNEHRSVVPLNGILEDKTFRESDAALPVALGRDTGGRVVAFDLAEAPNLLIAGVTKQGKSVAVNTLIASLLVSSEPEEVKFVLIDPKRAEFSIYEGLANRYLFSKPSQNSCVVSKPEDAEIILGTLRMETERRYEILSNYGARGIKSLPRIVIIFDEYTDYTLMSRPFKKRAGIIMCLLINLAREGHPVGIHLVITTQRPSIDSIPSVLKAYFPTRLAFRVGRSIDSFAIIDQRGAECLIGNGDMLFQQGSLITRVQGAYTSTDEVKTIVDRIATRHDSIPTSHGSCTIL